MRNLSLRCTLHLAQLCTPPPRSHSPLCDRTFTSQFELLCTLQAWAIWGAWLWNFLGRAFLRRRRIVEAKFWYVHR
ncbi:hypothetical protein M758_2G177000 [Ceratodon purpureus]|nr:hypothetical protein M758_2G177000 [Ceratodon purpureus]